MRQAKMNRVEGCRKEISSLRKKRKQLYLLYKNQPRWFLHLRNQPHLQLQLKWKPRLKPKPKLKNKMKMNQLLNAPSKSIKDYLIRTQTQKTRCLKNKKRILKMITTLKPLNGKMYLYKWKTMSN